MKRIIGFLVLAILLMAYLTTLQTIPNGSEHYYMIDVGETQNVLNQWGTLHATGYPLYVIVGNILVAGLRVLGVSVATAPGVTSLIYGMIALALIYVLAVQVIQPSTISEGSKTLPYESQLPPPRPSPAGERGSKTRAYLLAGGMTLLFGLTRTVWVHESIAEVYSFGLMILAGLFLLALWREPIRGRVYWLALLGGIGAFHHRAIAMAAPALIYAVWGEIVALTPNPSPSGFTTRQFWSIEGKTEGSKTLPYGRKIHWTVKVSSGEPSGRGEKIGIQRIWSIIRRVVICLVLGLLGFLQYIYLPLRANAGAKWVYGEPGSWDGFWDQFLGREASRFIGTPTTNAGLMANFNLVNNVLITDVTVVGIVLGLVGLVIALWNPARRKVAITMLLSGGVAYGFHVLYYTDILSALILPVTLALAFGWLLLAEWVFGLFNRRDAENTERISETPTLALPRKQGRESIAVMIVLGVITLVGVGYLVEQNQPFIREMTTNPTGLETIALLQDVPPSATFMLDWGPRYYAAAFAHDLWGERPDIKLVTHKADFRALVDRDKPKLVTADFTFYNRPVSWWEQELGSPVYLQGAGPHLVEISILYGPLATGTVRTGIETRNQRVICRTNRIELQVDWETASVPDHDLSVYVHLLDKDGAMIAQADEAAPVYGWRPLTSWRVDAAVHDVYALPRLPNADSIAYGLYRQLPSGEFQNEYTFNAAVKCDE